VPNLLTEFQRLADERCARLAKLTFAELNNHPLDAETIKLGGRTGSLTTHVEHRPDGSLRVVVHGLLPFRWMSFMSNVAVQGFYKHPDGSVSAIPDEEANELD